MISPFLQVTKLLISFLFFSSYPQLLDYLQAEWLKDASNPMYPKQIRMIKIMTTALG
jgi:hypothetical protein